MERKKKFFRKATVKRVLSFMLAFVMVLTMGAFSQLGGVLAKAEENAVKLYFELPEGTSAGDWAANVHGNNREVSGDAEGAFRPTPWGEGDIYPALLEDANLSGWGYVSVTGTIEGLQFVKRDGTEYNCWNSQITSQGLTVAYFSSSDSKWYAESAKTTVIEEPVIQNVFCILGETGLTGSDWGKPSDLKNLLVQNSEDTNKYSITFENVAAGTYSYKILQDPANKGWNLPWGSGSGSEGNRSVTVEALSNVTFTIDLTDPEKDVTDKGVTVTQEAAQQGTSEPQNTSDSGIKLYFELPEGTSAGDWAVNAWSDVTVIGGSEARIGGTWGNQNKPTLIDNNDGWGYVNVSGSVQGFQFVKWIADATDTTTKPIKYDCWNAQITNQGLTTAYFSPSDSKWYAESAKITVIEEAEIQNIFVLAGDSGLTGSNWLITDTNSFLTQDSDNTNKFSVTYTNVAAGTYSYKILQDPANKAWALPWGSGSGSEGNRSVTVDALSNVTFTIDLTDPEKDVTDKGVTVTQETVECTFDSPIVNADNTVTVNLDATGAYKDAETVSLMGTLKGSDWNTGLAMEKNEAGDLWTVTTTIQSPGIYEYKFKVGEDGWMKDPLNEQYVGDNSKVVISGLSNKAMDVARGKNVALPETLSFYDANGNETNVAVSYTLEDTSLADVVTISDGKVTVAAGSTVETVVLLAAYDTYTSKVTLSVKDKTYTYHIYYFDHSTEHMSVDAADIWAWENGGADIGAVAFTSLETLSDGKQWLKADVTTAASNIGLIPRSKGAWNWQTTNHNFNNKADAEECDIYIVYGDTKTYTELPEIKELRNRYAVVEYDRTAGDYEGWNIYSWNTGLASETALYTEEVNGKRYITVPIADYDFDFRLEFCMRKTLTDNEWAEKDGGDHYIQVPADQSVVKVKFVQGEGVTETLPYNKGYEIDGANDQIHFYYRDDVLFKAGTLSSLDGKVQVVINGQAYDMAYDAANERFCYDYKGLTAGDYQYHYVVDGVDMLDVFNSKKTEDERNSILTYKNYVASVVASLSKASMDYNDNNVLSISFNGDDAAALNTEEIASVQADLSALGLGTIDVDTALMKATIACLYTTAAGEKNIPVTVKDIYGNVYQANATVTVTERVKAAGDFDWDEAIIYFAVTDRFFDGSTANNAGVDKAGSLSYHGGDFAGLNQKLDYLKELGVNTIWITPIVENSDTTTEKDGATIESTGYHGYWASDFTKLNSHLGTEAEFSALLDAAHQRGMKIMVDVVLNHAGYETEAYFNGLLDGVTMIRDAENTVSGSDVYASLAGLPDFVTEDSKVREQLVQWQTDWMSKYPIDYYRIDTVKHVDYTTWAAFKNSLTAVNPDFKMIGEYAGAGYANTAGELGTGTMDALLDFDFNDFAQSFVGGNLSTVESKLLKRNTSINNTATMGSFIGSHDEDGLQYKLINESGFAAEQAADLMKVAATLQITAKGQPVIYYGEEIGLTGANNYPYQTNRYDFDWNKLAEQQKDNSSMYHHYETLLDIRNEYTDVFAKGTRSSIAVSDAEGYDIIARSYGKDTLYIGMNIKSAVKEVVIPVNDAAGSKYVNLYDGQEYTVAADQTVTISIPAAKDGGTVILAVKEDVKQPVTGGSGNGEASEGTEDDSEKVEDNTDESEKVEDTEKDTEDVEDTEEDTKEEDTEDVEDTKEDSEEEDTEDAEDSKDNSDEEKEDKKDDSEDVKGVVSVVKPLNVKEELIKVGEKLFRKLMSEAAYTIFGSAEVLPEGTRFEIGMPGTGSDVYRKAAEAMKSIAQSMKFNVLEITLFDAKNAEIHELADYVTVSLPVPANLSTANGNQIVVYRLAEDGTLVKCKTTVSNGIIEFETNHFSTFILSEEAISAVPNTSDNTAVFVFAGMMILLAGAAFVGYAYKKKAVK